MFVGFAKKAAQIERTRRQSDARVHGRIGECLSKRQSHAGIDRDR